MTAWELIGGAVTVAFAALLLCGMGYTGWRLVSCVGIVGVYLFTVGRVEEIIEGLLGTPVAASIGEVAETAVRMVGVGYVFGMVGELIRALGATELAMGVEVAGRVEIFAMAMPYLGEIIGMITGYLGV